MLRAQRRDPAKAQAKCAFATNYPLANRQLRSPLILRYRMQRDKPLPPNVILHTEHRFKATTIHMLNWSILFEVIQVLP